MATLTRAWNGVVFSTNSLDLLQIQFSGFLFVSSQFEHISALRHFGWINNNLLFGRLDIFPSMIWFDIFTSIIWLNRRELSVFSWISDSLPIAPPKHSYALCTIVYISDVCWFCVKYALMIVFHWISLLMFVRTSLIDSICIAWGYTVAIP